MENCGILQRNKSPGKLREKHEAYEKKPDEITFYQGLHSLQEIAFSSIKLNFCSVKKIRTKTSPNRLNPKLSGQKLQTVCNIFLKFKTNTDMQHENDKKKLLMYVYIVTKTFCETEFT